MHIEGRDRQDVYREWLREALKVTRKKPTPFATEAGLSASTVSRALDPVNPTRIKEETIDRLSEHWGIPLPIVTGSGQATGFAEAEAAEIPAHMVPDELKPTGPHQTVWRLTTRAAELPPLGYLPGDMVLLDDRAEARPGDLVCAQVYNVARGTAETVWRAYHPPYLLAMTTDPLVNQKPLLVDNDQVLVKGTVVKLLRTRG